MMGRFMAVTSRLLEDTAREPDAERKQKTAAAAEQQEEASPTIQTAQVASTVLFRRALPEQDEEAAGQAVHYMYGGLAGATYGVTAERIPPVTAGLGLPFGTIVWLGAAEVTLPALGLSRPPAKISPAAHASVLAAHLVYGLTTEFVRQVIRRRW